MEEDGDEREPFIDPSLAAITDYACRITLEFFGTLPAVRGNRPAWLCGIVCMCLADFVMARQRLCSPQSKFGHVLSAAQLAPLAAAATRGSAQLNTSVQPCMCTRGYSCSADRSSSPMPHLRQHRAQDVCRYLFDHGPSTLRDITHGTGVGRRRCCSALVALIQHSYVQPFVREELGSARTLNTATIYKVQTRAGECI